MPIYQEVLQRITVIERGNKEPPQSDHDIDSSDLDIGIPSGDQKKNPKGLKSAKSKKQKPHVDLRHILGFLNQTEWI